MCDITGNGQSEIVFSSVPNIALMWELYRFNGQSLDKIYSNEDSADLERDGFELTPLDDYRFKITGKQFAYEQIVSFIDIGLKEKDLEINSFNEGDRTDDITARLYNNGKVIKNNEQSRFGIQFLQAERWSPIYPEYHYFDKANASTSIPLSLGIRLGDLVVAKLNINLCYNVNTDKLEIRQAECVGINKTP